MIGFKVHARNESELREWQFGLTFDQRGLSQAWVGEKIWSYGFAGHYRYFDWKFGGN